MSLQNLLAYLNQKLILWSRMLMDQLPNIVVALIVVLIALYAARRVQDAVVRLVGQTQGRRELGVLLGRLARIMMLVAGALIILSIFRQTQLLASFIASLGIFGLLIAFALQDITRNFAAGVLLLLQRPFGLEDRIRVDPYEGTVTDIALRATVLRTSDGHEVLIPNAQVYSGTIVNLTRYPLRRHVVPLTLPLDVDAAAVRETLETALRAVAQLAPEPRPHVASTGVGKDDQQFEVRFWLRSDAPETPAIVSAVTLLLQQEMRTIHTNRAATP